MKSETTLTAELRSTLENIPTGTTGVTLIEVDPTDPQKKIEWYEWVRLDPTLIAARLHDRLRPHGYPWKLVDPNEIARLVVYRQTGRLHGMFTDKMVENWHKCLPDAGIDEAIARVGLFDLCGYRESDDEPLAFYPAED